MAVPLRFGEFVALAERDVHICGIHRSFARIESGAVLHGGPFGVQDRIGGPDPVAGAVGVSVDVCR